MGKRIGATLCACLLAFLLLPLNCRGEDSSALAEVIILLDGSGSMAQENSYGQGESCAQLATAWAQELCILLENKPVFLRLMIFHDHPEDALWPDVFAEDMSGINEDNLYAHLREIENIAFDGEYTNHLKALEHAQGSASKGNPRSIIMISDGKLQPNPNGAQMSGQGENKKEAFVNLCKTLDDAPDTAVYLLGLGSALELFEAVKNESQVTVFENEVNFEALTEKLLGEMGLSVQIGKNSEAVEDNFDFDLPDDLARAVICATYIGKNENKPVLTEETWQTVMPFCGDNPLEKRGFKLERSFYLYLDEPKAGLYRVELPEGTWNCKVLNLEQCIVNALYVTPYEEGRPLTPTECLPNNTYQISSWKETTLSITADTSGKGDPYSSDFKCCIWEAGDFPEDRIGKPIHDDTIYSDTECRKNREWEYTLSKLEPKKKYYCCVRMRVGADPIESEPIQLSVLDDVLSNQVDGSIEIPIEETKYLPKELMNIKTLEYCLDGPSLANETSLVKGEYNQEAGVDFGADGSLTFTKDGNYELSILNNGNTAAKIMFIIEDSDGGSSRKIDNIIKWLCNNSIPVVGVAATLILVLTFIFLTAMKQREGED